MNSTFKAELNQLHPMLDWVREKLQKTFSDPSKIRKFEVAVEEALVNIIRYAYQDTSGQIRLKFTLFQDRVELAIEDDGIPFNPLLQSDIPPVHLTAALEERKEGGLGIFFMIRNSDDIRYERIGSSNILILILLIKPEF